MRRFALAFILMLAAAGCESAEDVAPAQGTAPTGPTAATGTSDPSSPPPSPVEIPNVTGEHRSDALLALRAVALGGIHEGRFSHEPKGSVIKQTLRAGREVPEGTTVMLVVAVPFPKVPNVLPNNLTQARRILRRADYRLSIKRQNSTTQPDGDVVRQRPPAGSEFLPGRTVTLVVIHNICTPGYSPCIPEGADVDCAGGTGNGPRYIGTVRVFGFDPYDLDDDNDGIGCE